MQDLRVWGAFLESRLLNLFHCTQASVVQVCGYPSAIFYVLDIDYYPSRPSLLLLR